MGKMEGGADYRAEPLEHVLTYIETKKPKAYILETVPELMQTSKGADFNRLVARLRSGLEYEVKHRVLNTRDYGLPHNRKRVYIVGIRRDCSKSPFFFPDKVRKANI
jgi:DNA (cytosine-5)-methyltransferase 1